MGGVRRAASRRAKLTSGPMVARLFQRLLALAFLFAWLSLRSQAELLIGQRGLLPIEPLVSRLRATAGVSFWDFPTLFWWATSDAAIRIGIWVGIALALAALAGLRPRLCFLLSTILYLSYVLASRSFLAFQWDNLLLECGALVVLLPAERRAAWAHVLFRLLVFKLYLESGIAKWQSGLGDWQDGSAMTYYYETAPLPTWLAWYAHALPDAWHHFESRATLFLELGVPLLFFASRPFRLGAALVLTGFQLVNILTANYGFFAFLAIFLHVFLLDDAWLDRAERRVRSTLRRLRVWLQHRSGRELRKTWARLRLFRRALRRLRIRVNTPFRLPALRGARKPLRVTVAVSACLIWGLLSFSFAVQSFWPKTADRDLEFVPRVTKMLIIEKLGEMLGPLRIINVYHLFGHITRERYEPDFQTFDGISWRSHDLRFKPGDPSRRPGFVAPHQPRVDFLLWFYGLGVRYGAGRPVPPPTPDYVNTLLIRMCRDPAAVEPLFVRPLPLKPEAVRIVFWDYRFTTPDQKRGGAGWWRRSEITSTRAFQC